MLALHLVTEDMVSHVKTLGTLHMICGSLGVLCGSLVFLFFGGLAGLIGLTDASEGKWIAIPALGVIGGVIFLFALVLCLPSLVAGIGLVQFRSWARLATLVLSGLHLLNFPIGSALGFYGFWVLLSPGADQLFKRGPGVHAAA